MKRFILTTTMLLSVMCAIAQGLIVFKTDGSFIDIPNSELGYIQVYDHVKPDAVLESTFAESNFKLGGYPVKKLDRETGYMSIEVPYPTDLTAMTATFEIKSTSSVTINGIEQESDVSVNDFSMPVDYVVTDCEGNEYSYKVAICYGDLPMLYIDTHNTPIADRENYVENMDMLLINSDFDKAYSKARIKGRGNSSWNMPKKSYTFKLDKKDTFAGLKKHKTFALIANYCDKTLLRNTISYDMGNRIFTNLAWTPRTVECHLVHNGEYLGIYSITETIKIDKNRVDIPNIEDCTDIEKADEYGFIAEFNQRADENYNFKSKKGLYISLKEPDGADISNELKYHIASVVRRAENALYAADFNNPESENHWMKYIDVDSTIDWFLSNELAKNNDASFYSSVFIYYDPADGKIHMGPIWDYDIGYGNINYNGCDNPEGLWISSVGHSWPARLFKDEEFMARLRTRWQELYPQLKEYAESEVDRKAAELGSDKDNNFARWQNLLGQYTWPNADGYADRTTYESELEYLTNWMKERIEWLNTEFTPIESEEPEQPGDPEEPGVDNPQDPDDGQPGDEPGTDDSENDDSSSEDHTSSDDNEEGNESDVTQE